MSTHSALLVPLAVAESLRDCGAKAVNLARLAQLGYLVPSGMVLTDRAFQSHLRHAGVEKEGHALLSELPALKPAEIRARSAAVCAKVRDTSIEPRLRHDLGLAYETAWRGKRLAVRSSALGEDGRAASFAGQLESVLGVESYADLEEAIREVWASIWSERCLMYASRSGCQELRMGVVVQEQVNARYSGVLFTRNPLAAPQDGHAVIEYTTGLGSRLVAGEVNPDRVLVRRSDLAVIRDAAAEAPSGQGLADAILAELGLIGLELEQCLDAPQDIEWSVNADNAIVLLQARPITSTGHGAQRDIWSNANIAENFPDVVSPFLYSVVSAGYTAYFRNLGRSFGVSRRRLDAMSDALASIVGVHAGRLYYNLSSIHKTICLMPGGHTLARWFNEFTGAREFPAVQPAPGGSLGRRLELARVAIKIAWQYLWIHQRMARFKRTVEQYGGATHPARLAAKELADLADDLRRFLDIRLHRWNDAALADTAAMVCDGLLRRMLSTDSGGSSDTRLHGTLLSGLSELASARPIVELWRLSREIRSDEDLRRLFASATASEILERMAVPEGDAFRARFQRYLEVWGFRYSGELMLTSPTPREDPLPVIRLLQTYSREEGPGPLEVSARQADARERATSALAGRLTPERWLRWLPLSRAGRFRILLRAAQGAIRLRERARMQQALLYTRLRHVVLRIGEELASRGLLESRDDVFFLEAREVLALSAATGTAAATRETVRQRREERARWAKQQPPDSFALERGEQWRPDAGVAPAAARGLDGESLRGTSACGGLVEGNAAVVLDVTEADRLRAGDILVTRQTDPGWATVFFLIKGLVIERGGMLSHGAIIAREYGIPAVVGVPEATRRIRPGDRVRVDGDHGVIEVCRG